MTTSSAYRQQKEPDFSVLKDDTSPCVYGPIAKQRWSYACAKQLIERLIYGEASQNGLVFTIVRPFNCIGRRMNRNPCEVVPRVLSHFTQVSKLLTLIELQIFASCLQWNNFPLILSLSSIRDLLRGKLLRLFDGQQSQHTFVYIKDVIEAILLIIENPSRANGQIFNVGNTNNGVTRKQLAETMKQLYAKVSGESSSDTSTVDTSSNDKIGKFIPDVATINRQLDWNPKATLPVLLESTVRGFSTYCSHSRETLRKKLFHHWTPT